MPSVIFFACLDLEEKSSFMDEHYARVINVLYLLNHMNQFHPVQPKKNIFNTFIPKTLRRYFIERLFNIW